MTDEGGVLGNLPNSRPGKRSAKRDRPAGKARAKRTTAVKGPGSSDRVDLIHDIDEKGRQDPDSTGTPSDPVGAVVRRAAGLAVTGVKVAGAVTQELLRRLPRP